MATKELRVCDAYGTIKDVQSVKIVVHEKAANGEWITILERRGDLSPRGRDRLEHLIDRAFSSACKQPSKGCQTGPDGRGAE